MCRMVNFGVPRGVEIDREGCAWCCWCSRGFCVGIDGVAICFGGRCSNCVACFCGGLAPVSRCVFTGHNCSVVFW